MLHPPRLGLHQTSLAFPVMSSPSVSFLLNRPPLHDLSEALRSLSLWLPM